MTAEISKDVADHIATLAKVVEEKGPTYLGQSDLTLTITTLLAKGASTEAAFIAVRDFAYAKGVTEWSEEKIADGIRPHIKRSAIATKPETNLSGDVLRAQKILADVKKYRPTGGGFIPHPAHLAGANARSDESGLSFLAHRLVAECRLEKESAFELLREHVREVGPAGWTDSRIKSALGLEA